MKQLLPYLVLAGVVIVFFALCYFIFREPSKEKGGVKRKKQEGAVDRVIAQNSNHGPVYQAPDTRTLAKHENSNAHLAGKQDERVEDKKGQCIQQDKNDASLTTNESINQKASNSIRETTIAIEPVKESVLDMTAPTRVLSAEELQQALATSSHAGAQAVASTPSVGDATALIELVPTEAEKTELSPRPWADAADEETRARIAMDPLMKAMGTIGSNDQEHIQEITKAALSRLGIKTSDDVRNLMGHIVIQEALMGMQKAYAVSPTPWMKSIAVDAFVDVVQEPRTSTRYMIAFDALRILQNMTLSHMQILAISLLLQYSCNSNNYTLELFRHYVDKYISPFMSDLTKQESYFAQLKYAGCIQDGQQRIDLHQILSTSYPYVFNFEGFTREELIEALDGDTIDTRYVVHSLNSKMYKLALTDGNVAARLFMPAGIHRLDTQNRLLQLMTSRPVDFSGRNAHHIMKHISPVLCDLADIFDKSPLSTITLTLLGLYLGRLHVKAIIGQGFDLSQWV